MRKPAVFLALMMMGSATLPALGQATAPPADRQPVKKKVPPKAPPPPPGNGAANDPKKTPTMTVADLISVKIESSRAESVLGTPLGITADIKNNSQTALRFYERMTVLTGPPELRLYGDDSPFEGCMYFLTEGNPRRGAAPPGANGRDVIIQPNESYTAVWELGASGCSQADMPEPTPLTRAWWKLKWKRVLFQPGPYKVTFAARFYESTVADKYHTFTATQPVTLSAPQSMILLGAAIGGLLAWAVKRYMAAGSGGAGAASAAAPDPAGASTSQRVRTAVANSGPILELLGSPVLSVVLVILGSRMSEAFPIKVNANDFWGAITLGFIANYAGVALLQRIVPTTVPRTATPTTAARTNSPIPAQQPIVPSGNA